MSAESDRSESLMVPTKEELQTLPRWARVAFAARSARRVQPLFVKERGGGSKGPMIALDSAITMAEQSAATKFARKMPPINQLKGRQLGRILVKMGRLRRPQVEKALEVQKTQGGSIDSILLELGYISEEDLNLALAAQNGMPFVHSIKVDVLSEVITLQVYDNSRLVPLRFDDVADARATHCQAALRAMRRDFELLKVAAKERGWTDRTPVSPEFFGPLWPEGVPGGWPVEEENSEGVELVIQVEGPPGISDDELDKHVVGLVDRIDRLHRSYGGRGVTVDQIEIQDPVLVEVGS
ncbi:MAG: hypothetical protein AABZ47_11955 [Planctomycetota bacterium]